MSTGTAANDQSFTPTSSNKTHIFVAIYSDRPKSVSRDESHQSRHSHPDRWTILVEPHRHHRLSLHHHTDPKPVLFLISRDHTSSSWASHARHPEAVDDESLVGKIHIGQSKHASTVKIEELVRARLLPDGAEWPLDRTSEYWARAAVHALQEGGVVERFDLDDFMTFARAYVAQRQVAAPAAIEYAPVAKHASSPAAKKAKHGFWLSWSHSASNSPVESRESSSVGLG
jgi:hypothetical protein